MARYIDFIGFQFNGKHSSDMGVLRVSDGSRYNDGLVPDFSDVTEQVPGGDGTYYWDSFYSTKTFNIDIAYDKLTEKQFRDLRQWLNAKEMGQLIFDESPYKYYMAKISGAPQWKYICFNENNQRVYKGEGSVSFVCYFPYAKNTIRFYSQATGDRYANKAEWREAANLPASGTYPLSGGSIAFNNCGDLPTDFKAYYAVNSTSFNLTVKYDTTHTLTVTGIVAKGSDTHIMVNSRTHLIHGGSYSNGVFTESGNLYNELITAGDFFKLPIGTGTFTSTGKTCTALQYDYLYY